MLKNTRQFGARAEQKHICSMVVGISTVLRRIVEPYEANDPGKATCTGEGPASGFRERAV